MRVDDLARCNRVGAQVADVRRMHQHRRCAFDGSQRVADADRVCDGRQAALLAFSDNELQRLDFRTAGGRVHDGLEVVVAGGLGGVYGLERDLTRDGRCDLGAQRPARRVGAGRVGKAAGGGLGIGWRRHLAGQRDHRGGIQARAFDLA